MDDVAERFIQLTAKEMKIRLLTTIPTVILGLGAQAAINPPEAVVPFLRQPTFAYFALGIGIVGTILCSVLIVPVFKEKAAIAKAHKRT